MLTDSSKAVVALASRLGDSRRPSLSPTEWDRFSAVLADQQLDVAMVFDDGFDAESLPGVTEKISAKINTLLETAGAATVEAADLGRFGITTITIVDDAYPNAFRQRLGNLAPPVIYAVGNLDLLSGDGVGIVGSRNVTEEGKTAAEEMAREAVRNGRSVISGGARGVDSFAMNAAFMAGGTVVGVLADSLQGRIRKSGTLQAIDEGTVCLLSQQIPSAGFTPHAAMARNKLVYALSEVTVVVAADHETGGTWAGAIEALKKHNGRIAVWTGDGAGPGNSALVNIGGSPLTSPDQLFDAQQDLPTEPSEQLGLLDSA
ncbi:MAG: DNA-processing protein DprA [Actinomycetota bacterium]|nr:DNA-processing protein DprA [Actinomycetota bacterium]MDK1026869.1 DNA-processing protein DprA [Actinomycetota bacterium]MDK1104067.1 DNA-processing protein DprA [Actinomycetota bacterium]